MTKFSDDGGDKFRSSNALNIHDPINLSMSWVTSQESKILLLEDDEIDQLTVEKIVESHLINASIVKIGSLSEMNSILQDNGLEDFDLIIMDLGLPDGDSLSKINNISLNYHKLKIIVISGQDDIRIATKTLEYGASSYIVKGKNFSIDFLSSFGSAMRQINLEKHIQKYVDHLFKSDYFPTAVFSVSELGPIVHLRDFDNLPIPNEMEIEFFLLRTAVTFITAIGQGHEYSEGYYELPVPYLPNYKALLFSFTVTDKKSNDKRLNKKSIVIYCIFVTNKVRALLPKVSKFETLILPKLKIATDLSQIDMKFLLARKKEILDIIKANIREEQTR